MFRKMFIGLAIGLSLVVVSCSTSATRSPASPTSPATSQPAAVPPTSQSAPAPTTAPANASVAPTATRVAPSPTTASSAASGPIRFKLVPEKSEARYRVREQLAQRNLPSDAVGTTKAISGAVVVGPNGAVDRDQSKFMIDLRTLTSDESKRDNYIKGNTLETSRFPNAGFVITGIQGLPSPLPASGEGQFKVVGDLTIHGVTRPTTWEVTARLNGQELTGKATTSITFTDFGMTAPKVLVVLSVEETIRLELDFTMIRE